MLKRLIFILALLSFGQIIQAQNKLFIEPCLSFEYDTNQYKISAEFTGYSSETYMFNNKNDTGIFLGFIAQYNSAISDSTLNAMANESVNSMKGLNTDSMQVFKSETLVINGFIGSYMISKVKVKNEWSNKIFTYYGSDAELGSLATCFYSSKSKEEKAIAELKNILREAKVYSSDTLSYYRELVKNRYKFVRIDSLSHKYVMKFTRTDSNGVVTKVETTDLSQFSKPMVEYDMRSRPQSFKGQIVLSKELKHKVKEIKLSYTQRGTVPSSLNQNQKLIFVAADKEKGNLKKRGELHIYSDIGSTVIIPFTFSYWNK